MSTAATPTVGPARTSPSPASRGVAGAGLRADIQALRALAVVAVLLYHLWPNRLTGGYVGVDVFFVISGYLITSHLLSELVGTGRLRLGRFWARRARRLLPASLLVLLATGLAVVALVPTGRWPQFLGEVSASALYVQNWVLAADSVDYLAATGNTPSPVQHFWTLSVEEQFYVLVPVLLVLAARLARSVRRGLRSASLAALVLATTASFGYSLWLTATAAPVSYFSTFSRAWEFGVGALLSFLPVPSRSRLRQVATVGGVGMVLVSVATFTDSTGFPGAGAVLPVCGTALAIWGGRGTVLAWSGSLPPVAFLGRTSYATYLWHWPLVVLLPYATGRPLTLATKLGVIGATLLLAGLSTRFVEDPVRFSPRLLGGERRPRTVAAWSVAGMVAVLALAVPSAGLAERRAASEVAAGARLQASAECLGAAVMATGCVVDADLADTLLPVGPAVADDVNRSECWSTRGDGSLRVCSLGPETGYTKRLLAVGDSHNNTLLGAYEAIARSMNWRIDVAGRIGCYWTRAEMTFSTSQLTAECRQWRDEVSAFVRGSTDLDGVVVTHARETPDGAVVPRAGESIEDATVRGLQGAWQTVPEGVPVLGLVDNPAMTRETIACVEREGLSAATDCTRPRAAALADRSMQRAVAATPGAHLLDLSDLYCEDDVCRPVIGHVIVYRDPGHLTAAYAQTVAPSLADRIARALG